MDGKAPPLGLQETAIDLCMLPRAIPISAFLVFFFSFFRFFRLEPLFVRFKDIEAEKGMWNTDSGSSLDGSQKRPASASHDIEHVVCACVRECA